MADEPDETKTPKIAWYCVGAFLFTPLLVTIAAFAQANHAQISLTDWAGLGSLSAAIATAVFTWGLVKVGRMQAEILEKQISLMAKQTDISDRANVATNRPKLILNRMQFQGGPSQFAPLEIR